MSEGGCASAVSGDLRSGAPHTHYLYLSTILSIGWVGPCILQFTMSICRSQRRFLNLFYPRGELQGFIFKNDCHVVLSEHSILRSFQLERWYPVLHQVDCLALICVNHAFLRMVRKYELNTHFPVVYAYLRAVRKFAMILVWCPACTPVRLHHSPWAGVSLGFRVRKKHVIIVQVLVSYCQQIELWNIDI